MNLIDFYYYFNLFRDILILIQILLVLSLIFRKMKENVNTGLIIYGKFIFLTLVISFLLFFFKNTFPSLRPISYLVPNLILNDSFPSGHALFSFSYTFFVMPLSFRFFIFSLIISVLISIFSIISFSHFLIDIIFSIFLAIFIAIISQEILYFFHRFYVHYFKKKT